MKYEMQKLKHIFPPLLPTVKTQYKKEIKSFDMGTLKPSPSNSGISFI